MSLAWKGFHSWGPGFSPAFGASITSGITPIGSWDASTSTLAQLAALVSHSRTSLATMFDSTGKLTYAPNNLLTQSNTFSNAAWTKNLVTVTGGVSDPVGGSNASTITATGVNAFIYQGPTVAAGTRIASQLYVKRRTGSGSVFLYDQNGFTNTVDITASISGGGWVAINPSVLTASGSNAYIGVKINTSGDAVDVYAGVVAAVTYETAVRTQDQVITTSAAYYGPRIDYDPNTLAVKGLLIEEARTNLAFQSADVANAAWTKSNITATANATTAPDGTATAASLMETAVIGARYVFNASAITVAATTQYTGSTFLKANGRNWVIVAIEMNGNSYGKYVDLSTGTIGSTYVSAPDNFSIVNCGNGWYRVSMSKASISAGASGYITTYGTTADAASNTYLGDITKGYYRWGSQFEQGSFATSYIPTATASVARAADVVQFTGAALTALQGSAGSAIVETTDSRNTSAVLIGANTLSDYRLFWDSSAAKNYNGTYLISGAANPANPARAAVAWSAAGRSIVANGGTVSTDGTPIVQGAAPFYLGAYSGSLYNPNAHFKSFAIYNQRLPDATLQARSVVGASY